VCCAAHRHNCWLHSRGGDRAGLVRRSRNAACSPRSSCSSALPCPQLARRHLVGKPEPLDAEPVPEWRQLVHQRGRRAAVLANLGVWLLVALLVGAMFQLFNRTRLGLHMRATASNRESAALRIPTGRILLLAGHLGGDRAVAGCSSRRSILTPSSRRDVPLLIYDRPPPSSVARLAGGPSSPAS